MCTKDQRRNLRFYKVWQIAAVVKAGRLQIIRKRNETEEVMERSSAERANEERNNRLEKESQE